jgi:hypothetical protein
MLSFVLVCKVENTFKVAFELDDYAHFVSIQSETVIKKLAKDYPYDNFDDVQAEIKIMIKNSQISQIVDARIK